MSAFDGPQSWIIKSKGRNGLDSFSRTALLEKHYLRRLPPISWSFSWFYKDKLAGVVTFGVPASRNLQQSACPTSPDSVLELNRLWIADEIPKGAASWFLSLALRDLTPCIVVSYADTVAGHHGGVYRAANFFYAGWTDMDRKTPRYDYIPRNGKHSRDAFCSGEYDRVRRKPKVKYWTVCGNRSEKRALLKISGWPRLNWKELPSPEATS